MIKETEEPPRRIQRLASALQKEVEIQLINGMPPVEAAAILTELAIRYAQEDPVTAYATLIGMAEDMQHAAARLRS